MANKNWYNKTWKPVDVGYSYNKLHNRGAGIGSVSSNAGWFDKLIQMANHRQDRLDIYDKMDQTLDISRGLDIIAEDISSENVDDDTVFTIDFPDTYNVKKRTIDIHTSTLRKWMSVTNLEYSFFDYSREALKYGIVIFRRKRKEGTWRKVDSRDIIGAKVKDSGEVSHYYIDTGKRKQNGEMDPEPISVTDLTILKVGEGPFGTSILDKVYRTWKQYTLLEDALVIYRIVRAPERRVFYVSVGDQPTKKAQAMLNQTMRNIKQKQISKSNGDLETVYNPANIQEDYFISQDSDGRGSRIETLPGGQSLGQIEELDFFNKRIALGLRIPPSYMDTFSQDRQGQIHNDGRLGTAYIVELRYAGYVKRLQKIFSQALRLDFEKYAAENEIILDNNMIFRISPPQSFGIYKENELNIATLNAYSTSQQIESLSKKFAMMKYLNLSAEEMEDNEKKKTEEMGLVYEDLSPQEIANAVYGDGSLVGKKKDGGFGF